MRRLRFQSHLGGPKSSAADKDRGCGLFPEFISGYSLKHGGGPVSAKATWCIS